MSHVLDNFNNFAYLFLKKVFDNNMLLFVNSEKNENAQFRMLNKTKVIRKLFLKYWEIIKRFVLNTEFGVLEIMYCVKSV